MKLLTGLFRASRKRVMTKDNDMGTFRDKLNELVAQKDALSDDEIAQRVEELKGITNDLPDDEGKSKLLRFLEDFKAVKEQDAKVAEEAAAQVANQFEKLDTAAMQDVPGVEPEATETTEETVEEGSATETEPTEEVPAEETTAEEIAEETEAPESEEETGDADPNAEYSLEEIYQFIKKRMAEDAEAESEPEEETEETSDEEPEKELEGEELINSLNGSEEEVEDECDEKKEDEVVTDHAPRIPVTVNDNAPKGSLSALFELAKRG